MLSSAEACFRHFATGRLEGPAARPAGPLASSATAAAAQPAQAAATPSAVLTVELESDLGSPLSAERAAGSDPAQPEAALGRDDLKLAMTALLGFRPSKWEVDEILAKLGVDGGAQLDADSPESAQPQRVLSEAGFVDVMRRKLAHVDSDDEIRAMFMAFDVKCRGFLVLEDVLACFAHACPWASSQVVMEAFALADSEGTGRVGYGNFQRVMREGCKEATRS